MMPISENKVVKISDREVQVNGQSICLDMNNKWSTEADLKPSEIACAKGFIESTFGTTLES